MMRAPDDGAGMSAKEMTLEDAVPRDAPGMREIGFSVPARYNASAILYDNLAANGWRPAVIGPAGTRTYAELASDAAAFGAGLLSLGLRRGDRVLLFLDDTPAYPAALFGAIRAGLVPLLINTLTPSDLLQFYLSDSGATVAVADAAFADRFNATACGGTRLETLVVTNGEAAAAGPVATQSAAPWLAGPAPALPPADTHRDDMAFWMY
jgi:acyl-CoA synthetase (AMP-forming)/AMP-acid ligase II